MVKLTKHAIDRIHEVLRTDPGRYTGLRVGLQDGGCSGYTYMLEFEPTPDDDDLVFEQDGAKIFVHPLHLPYIAGSSLDWTEGDLQSGFQLDNPNVKQMCGCGESFNV